MKATTCQVFFTICSKQLNGSLKVVLILWLILCALFKEEFLLFSESFGPLESSEWDPTGFFSFKQ